MALSKVQSVDQRMRLECGVGFRQLRTCRSFDHPFGAGEQQVVPIGRPRKSGLLLLPHPLLRLLTRIVLWIDVVDGPRTGAIELYNRSSSAKKECAEPGVSAKKLPAGRT